MKNFKTTILIAITIIAITFTACSSDDEVNGGFDGSARSIKDFFGERAVDSINKLGIVLNTGNTPPNIVGSYLVSPQVLKKSLVPGDNIGLRFVDLKAAFTNQNNNDLTIDYKEEQGSIATSISKDSYISGSGNKFSVFLKTDATFNNNVLKLGLIISGEISANGIANFHQVLMMLDNKGDTAALKNFEGRLIYEQDGSSPMDTTPPSKKNFSNSNDNLKSSISFR